MPGCLSSLGLSLLRRHRPDNTNLHHEVRSDVDAQVSWQDAKPRGSHNDYVQDDDTVADEEEVRKCSFRVCIATQGLTRS